MAIERRGSIFLIALTALTILFILGFSMTFFTGQEDWSSALSYESEVSFNLAESAVEEFVARLKNSLNFPQGNNQLYRVLRDAKTDISKSIPLEAAQVANLTSYTRETARQIYGIQFGQGLVSSRDFSVDASLKLKHMNAVEAKNGNQVLYTLRPDPKEKEGELTVVAIVSYRGKTAKVSLSFLIRVVKIFVPPFNYFTLYIKDGSFFSGTNLNCWKSDTGYQEKNLVLDNGWNSIKPKFDAVKDVDFWEDALSQTGSKGRVPPGRVYIGRNPNPPANMDPLGMATTIHSTNGAKLLSDCPTDGQYFAKAINGQENLFLKYDVGDSTKWMGLKDYTSHEMKAQGQEVAKAHWWNFFSTGWDNKTEVRIRNVGSGYELDDAKLGKSASGQPMFNSAIGSFIAFRKKLIEKYPEIAFMNPDVRCSGIDLFGYAKPAGASSKLTSPNDPIDTSYISPTIVYGSVWRKYFRVVSVRGENDTWPKDTPFRAVDLPFWPVDDSSKKLIPWPFKTGNDVSATEASQICKYYEMSDDNIKVLINNWDNIPGPMKKLSKYDNFMSNSDTEPYNMGLGNLIQRIRKNSGKISTNIPYISTENKEPPLKRYVQGAVPRAIPGLENSGFFQEDLQSPMSEYFNGDFWYALPEMDSAYLMDFFFIPRSTEDFFRGRMTISAGGSSWDRFVFKYINDVRSYLSNVSNQTLELNGILVLNDSTELVLRNLTFRGHGVIYSSPMMGGGPVIIAGDFFPVKYGSPSVARVTAADRRGTHDMMTIVAPQILIDTSKAQGDPCYVEANLISVNEPIRVLGSKRVHIKGMVACPYLDLEKSFGKDADKSSSPGGVIEYNPLNSIWRIDWPDILDELYVAKIVTGGVGRFDWRYDRVLE